MLTSRTHTAPHATAPHATADTRTARVRWEPQEEGVMRTAASFPSERNQGLRKILTRLKNENE